MNVSNTPLAAITVMPLYNQIVIQNPDTEDIAQWESGDEVAVSSSHSVAISTRPDFKGDVEISILSGNDTASLGDLIFDGKIILTGTELEVGSPQAGDVVRVRAPGPGHIRVRAFGDQPVRPSSITVLLSTAR